MHLTWAVALLIFDLISYKLCGWHYNPYYLPEQQTLLTVTFSCTDKGKVDIPKEELVLSAEDGKYLICVCMNIVFFSVFSPLTSQRVGEFQNCITAVW